MSQLNVATLEFGYPTVQRVDPRFNFQSQRHNTVPPSHHDGHTNESELGRRIEQLLDIVAEKQRAHFSN